MTQVAWNKPNWIRQLRWLWENALQEESATNEVTILHQQDCKVSRYSDYFIWKDKRSPVKQSYQMIYSLTSWLSINQTTTINKHLYFRALYKPNLIFIPHYVSLHKNKLRTYHLHWNHTNFYSELELCDKTYFVATIKYLLSNFDDNLKEYMKEPLYTKMQNLMQNPKNSYKPYHSLPKRIIPSFHWN